jgi:glycosyltransferase involved in cell wall biosynthesis
MRICYVLLSPTFGMHQYTADLANRMVRAGHQVSLVTTCHYPGDRYLPEVLVCTPVETRDTGFSADALRFSGARAAQAEIDILLPDVVHITGPHAWNIPLLWLLRQAAIPVIHSLHDLEPHSGAAYGQLLQLWNRCILRQADHILVHGRHYKERLLDSRVPPERVTYTPLLHLSVGACWLGKLEALARGVCYEPWGLFFGRIERYKGVDHLLTAGAALDWRSADVSRLVLAGPGELGPIWPRSLPPGVEVRSRLIRDEEALELFSRCGLVLLPYRDATQSALVAHAYYFRKPALVTRTGALPEYVVEGETGWVVPPEDPLALAATLEEALHDPARLARMGEAGRATYDRERHAEQHTLREMYARIAGTRASRPGLHGAPGENSRWQRHTSKV